MGHEVIFRAKEDEDGGRDGEAGWVVTVDGQAVAEVDNDELDVADNALQPLWEALGITVTFDYK